MATPYARRPRRDELLIVVLSVVAAVALLIAAGAAAFAVVRSRDDRQRIDTLEREVRTLCARKTITHLQLGRTGKIVVHTQQGC